VNDAPPPLPLLNSTAPAEPGYHSGQDFFIDRARAPGPAAMLDRGSEHVRVTDVVRWRTKLYKALADHPDPMWREIGGQLRDGKMTLRDIYRVEAYREHLHEGFEKNRHRFVESVRQATQQLEEAAAERVATAGTAAQARRTRNTR
jgi:hypothetical protein